MSPFIIVALCSASLALPVRAADKSLGASLGAAAAKLAGDGKIDKAKELCYKALANDEEAAEALYELGKIFERENRPTAAGDFLVRAARQFAQGEAANPAFAAKRQDAERRVKGLNPYATRFTEAMTEYAKDLGAITKKTPDSMTAEEALDRITTLQLANIVPPDKLPAIEKPAPKTTAKDTNKLVIDDDGRIHLVKKEVANSVPPDVERALKSAGWTTITGTWKKNADNVYEVTNGKLETPKVNGAVQVLVYKGGTGSVKVLVRNEKRESSFYADATGFGFKIDSKAAKLYTPSNFFSSSSSSAYKPWMEREVDLSSAPPKFRVLITVNEGNLEMNIKEKREHKSNYKLAKEGSFVIEVDGTATIESPQAAGQ